MSPQEAAPAPVGCRFRKQLGGDSSQRRHHGGVEDSKRQTAPPRTRTQTHHPSPLAAGVLAKSRTATL